MKFRSASSMHKLLFVRLEKFNSISYKEVRRSFSNYGTLYKNIISV